MERSIWERGGNARWVRSPGARQNLLQKDKFPCWYFRSLYLKKRPFNALPRNDAMGHDRPFCITEKRGSAMAITTV